jgi:hypothetical protein
VRHPAKADNYFTANSNRSGTSADPQIVSEKDIRVAVRYIFPITQAAFILQG